MVKKYGVYIHAFIVIAVYAIYFIDPLRVVMAPYREMFVNSCLLLGIVSGMIGMVLTKISVEKKDRKVLWMALYLVFAGAAVSSADGLWISLHY